MIDLTRPLDLDLPTLKRSSRASRATSSRTRAGAYRPHPADDDRGPRRRAELGRRLRGAEGDHRSPRTAGRRHLEGRGRARRTVRDVPARARGLHTKAMSTQRSSSPTTTSTGWTRTSPTTTTSTSTAIPMAAGVPSTHTSGRPIRAGTSRDCSARGTRSSNEPAVSSVAASPTGAAPTWPTGARWTGRAGESGCCSCASRPTSTSS
jgi:hypothetical protein